MPGLRKFVQNHEALVWLAVVIVASASWVVVLQWEEKRHQGPHDPHPGLAPELFEDVGVGAGIEYEQDFDDSFDACRANLDVIAGWLYKYKGEHGGRAPQTLEEFHDFQDFIAATAGWTRQQCQEMLFICPITGEPYRFLPGAGEPTDILIAETKPCCGDECYVILVNGELCRRRAARKTSP